MLGQLPDLRETQSGKDLIAIGKIEGKIEALLELLHIRFGEVESATKDRILKIDSIKSIDELYKRALIASSLSEIF